LSSSIISFKNVFAGYNGRNVVENITFNVDEGDFIGIVGPNGGGKTTLLRLILGIVKPSKGELLVFGKSPFKFTEFDRRRIGYVRQETHIDTSFPIRVIDVVQMGLYAKIGIGRRLKKKHEQEALDILGRVGMSDYIKTHIGALSGGQKQRVFIARGLVNNPELLILDEPTTGVDAKNQYAFYQLLYDLKNELNLTIIMVSHDVSMISKHVNKVTYVNRGVHLHGEPEDVLNDHETCEVCGLDMDMIFREKRKGKVQ
jgi:zinc transport system ATP-binding protein